MKLHLTLAGSFIHYTHLQKRSKHCQERILSGYFKVRPACENVHQNTQESYCTLNKVREEPQAQRSIAFVYTYRVVAAGRSLPALTVDGHVTYMAA